MLAITSYNQKPHIQSLDFLINNPLLDFFLRRAAGVASLQQQQQQRITPSRDNRLTMSLASVLTANVKVWVLATVFLSTP